ncbi:MAG: ABC transporter permease subunit [Anaerolineales bacterium]|jgi:ABC-type sugar transport system permease subunit|nr:ABC transporter permease subunit [Anaerolineales bacterium]
MTTAIQAKNTRKSTESPLSTLIRVILIVFFDVGAIWFIQKALSLGFNQLAVVIGVITLMFNLIFLLSKAYAYRWMALGLGFMILLTIYPMLFTLYIAFTNYGDGHLLTKEQAIPLIEKIKYLAEDGATYSWTAYKSTDGRYALWLVNPAGETFLGKQGEEIIPATPGGPGIGEADAKGIPASIEGYKRINALVAASDKTLPDIVFGTEDGISVQISSPSQVAAFQQRFRYDPETDTVRDLSNNDVYNNVEGTFTTLNGKTIKPGFRSEIGLQNFINFTTSPALSGPLVTILIWNFIFPLVSVLSTFSLGLAIAIMYNDKDFPFKKIIRTLLLIPYTIPSVITILIWRGMLNPEFGVINRLLQDWIGIAPPWTTEAFWARTAVLLVNLWLGFPYMMLITSGALQSIPSDLYEAATIDGAGGWKKFRAITLPLLLVAVGPLLIASFTFNFNNFGLIYLFIGGGPPIAGASTQAGYTDILISYVYNLAFASGGRGVQYGLGSAISFILFFIVGAITLFQFRYTKMWEEVSENG